MSANKKSSLVLLGLFLAVAFVLGVFAIMDASTANASPGEFPPPTTKFVPSIIISPRELEAALHVGEQVTQTLWITNTGDTELSFSIYEITRSMRTTASIIQPAALPVIDPELQSQVKAQGSSSVIILLREKPDFSATSLIPDKVARRQYVYSRLLETASHSQRLFNQLVSQGTNPKRLLIANAIAATLNTSQLAGLATNPQVRQITNNRQVTLTPTNPSTLISPPLPVSPPLQPATVEWNIAKIRADDAWSTFGVTGEGAVVGIVDTGVQYDHPALVNSYRGNLGGGNFDHNYNWYDFVNHQPVPYDPTGHGTMGAGIISGDDGAGNQIGVAPGANWIAVIACDNNGCTDVDLLAALEWMLAPTDLNNQYPDPAKAPDVVLGMWGGGGCNPFYEPSLQALRAANILPVFSPGANGPSCSSMGSPADLAETLTAGATDQSDVIASFSSRGPVLCSPGLIKPDMVAPGVNIRSSFNNHGYQVWSGTSLSAAHAAGVAALVISADSSLGADEAANILTSTALCIDNNQCGGGSCPEPNYVYGHGRIDAYRAVYAALGNPPTIDLPWLSEAPISATLQAGEGMPINITFDSTGLQPSTYKGALGILSNDPIQPFTTVSVTMSVTQQPGPMIVIDPISFSVSLPMDGVHTDTLTISNAGSDILTYSLHEITGSMQLLSAPIVLNVPNVIPPGAPAQVDAEVPSQLLFLNKSRLIIYLHGQPDFSAAYQITDRATRGKYVYGQLLAQANQSNDLYTWLLTQGTNPRRLLSANAIAASIDKVQLKTVLSFPQVRRVGINASVQVMPADPGLVESWLNLPSLPGTLEWNIAKIGADQVWSTFGIRGQGAVVGVVDTGVMLTHPALNAQYRGNLGDGNYENNYNWYDLINGQTLPYDDNGHGTFGMGIAVGYDGGDNQIGVAPGAQWVAVKALDAGGGTSLEQLQAALDWMLAPTDLNGANPDPSKAPQVVLNMWRWMDCGNSFDQNLVALRAANILPVFAPGSEGPGCGLVAYPAANPNALSAGSTDINDVVSGFSARGPSCYDGGIKPDVVAPGVEVRSSTIDGSYQVWSGTSFSTAHLAGAAALLFSAKPDLTVDQLEQTLFDTAVCYDESSYCGGETCPGPNNTYGHGRIDVYGAVVAVMGQPFDLPWLDEIPTSGSLNPGESSSIAIMFNAAGLQPGTYTGGIAVESNDPLAPLTILPVTLTVTAPCQPIVDLTAVFTPLNPAVGEVVTFTASASGTFPIIFTWDFLDGSPSTGPVVTHVFETPGSHFVGLLAENACDLKTVDLAVPVEAVLQRVLLPLVGR